MGICPWWMSSKDPTAPPSFMAPEMAGAKIDEVGPATDQYLLGTTLHYVLTGEARHHGENVAQIMFEAYRSDPVEYPPAVPAPLGRICNKAAARDIEDRFESVEALREAIAGFRNHREAQRLIRIARAGFDHFRAMIEQEDREEEMGIYRLYGEMHFAAKRALMIQPADETIRQTLAEMYRLMFGFELGQDNPSAARAILRDLEELDATRPEDEATLKRLEEELEQRQKELRALEEMRDDLDAGISRGRRALVISALAITWGIIAAVSRLLWTWDVLAYNSINIVAVKVFNTLLGVAFIAWAPRLMKLNRINRQMLAVLAVAMLSGLIIRSAFQLYGLPIHLSLATETVGYAVCISALGIFVSARLLIGVLFFLCTIFGVPAFPTYCWEILITFNMLGLLVLGVVWALQLRELGEHQAPPD